MERKTRQREAIREVLAAATRPLSPAEILAKAHRELPRLGIATVYRTIKALVGQGDIVPVEIPGRPTRYESAGKSHHHHFACTGCDRTYELEGCPGNVDRLAPAGFQVDAHDIILYGRCADCRRGG